MTRWVPSGLSAPFLDFARALEKQFAPIRPARPVRLPSFAQTSLTDDFAADNPYGLAINSTTGGLVVSVLVGGVWTWRDYDGSAL